MSEQSSRGSIECNQPRVPLSLECGERRARQTLDNAGPQRHDAGMNTPVPNSGRACGKVILLGEHFVVHGAPALAAPLRGWETEVQLLPDASVVDAPGVPREEVVAALVIACEAWGLLMPGIRVRSRLPMGAGLGSSAAFAMALARALAATRPDDVGFSEINRVADLLEKRVHGNPSGLDTAVVGLEALIRFERDGAPRPIACAREGVLVVADTGVPGSTMREVARVHAFAAREPDAFRGMLRETSDDVEKAIDALESGDFAALGVILDTTHARLQECGVSTHSLDTLVSAARAGGALGAKLTGAGGGGCVVALAREGEEATLSKSLTDAGACHVMRIRLPAGGR